MSEIKKLISTGIGAVLMTEEGIRNAITGISLPRDAKKYLMDQASRRKEEVTSIISSEVKNFLSRINLHEEVKRALNGMTIDIQATIRLSDKLAPKLKSQKISTRKTPRKASKRK